MSSAATQERSSHLPVSQNNLTDAREIIKMLVACLHPGAIGLIGAHHGEEAINKCSIAVTQAKAFLATRPVTNTSIKVKHWDAYHIEGTVATHQFDVDDQRVSNGQVFAGIGALEGLIDDMLAVTMEVTTNPLNGIDHVPCAHIHFDDSNLAVSLFKIGDKILVRPESEVAVTPFDYKMNGVVEKGYWIE
jgi:hypothetical protein